jgi:MFS superfamily sulfate permease-like transporter
MAYAGIANVPPIVGLYTVPIPMIAYAGLGTSRNMVIGPDSATALISGVTVERSWPRPGATSSSRRRSTDAG